jgi:hypothetical protein
MGWRVLEVALVVVFGGGFGVVAVAVAVAVEEIADLIPDVGSELA